MKFIQTTLIGGFLFLLPISILLFLFAHIHRFTEHLLTPVADWLPFETLGGLAIAKVLTILAIVAVCFITGFLTRSSAVARWINSLDHGLTGSIPGYAFLRSTIDGFVGDESEQKSITSVLLDTGDGWLLAFAVEKLDDGRIVLFIPDAPDPSAGQIMIVEESRVEPLNQSMAAVTRSIRALGRGTNELVKRRKENV